MKKILLVVAALCLLSATHAARPKPTPGSKYESYTFKEYAKHVFILCDFLITPPEGFKETKWFDVMWVANSDMPGGTSAADLFGPVCQSKDGQCLVMYAYMPRDLDLLRLPNRLPVSGRPVAKYDIESNLMDQDGDLPSYRLDDYLSVIPTPLKGLSLVSTDSTYIYTIPYGHKTQLSDDNLESLRASRFPHCMGINIIYYQESRMHLKVYLSDEGLKNKDLYLDRILKSIERFLPNNKPASKRKNKS